MSLICSYSVYGLLDVCANKTMLKKFGDLFSTSYFSLLPLLLVFMSLSKYSYVNLYICNEYECVVDELLFENLSMMLSLFLSEEICVPKNTWLLNICWIT